QVVVGGVQHLPDAAQVRLAVGQARDLVGGCSAEPGQRRTEQQNSTEAVHRAGLLDQTHQSASAPTGTATSSGRSRSAQPVSTKAAPAHPTAARNSSTATVRWSCGAIRAG